MPPSPTVIATLVVSSFAVSTAFLGAACREDVQQARERELVPGTFGEPSATRDASVRLTSAEQRGRTFERDRGVLPMATAVGQLEVVARFDGPMPTGVAVSRGGRIFVNFPRWGDPVEATVTELREGMALPFPDRAINRWPPSEALGDAGRLTENAKRSLVSVQSVVVDAQDRLWIVDTGAPMMKETIDGGPKLMAIELATNRIAETILIPPNVALKTSYLNDVRFDLTRGTAGFAFITDSSSEGPNGIVVVDLGTKKSKRRLHDHPSTKPVMGFVPIVEGAQVRQEPAEGTIKPLAIGADGIAISADGARLYYCPLSSRHLYSVSVEALVGDGGDAAVAATVVDHGEKGASDGLESDAQGRIYLTDYEHNAIRRTRGDGLFETLVSDPRALWPDTMSLAHDGFLYFTANQLHRQPRFHGGTDHRVRPYVLFRTKVDGTPVALTR